MNAPLVEAPLAKLIRLRELREALAERETAELAEKRARWRADPVLWVQERLGEHVWSAQAQIMESVRDNPRTAVQSCHGIGKSHIASRLAAWWIDTQPEGDAFLVTTAPRWDQVVTVLWRYIRQVHRAHDLPGLVTQDAQWKINGDPVGYGRKPADTDASGFQGVHATKGAGVLAIVDEACGVPAQLFVAVDSLATNDASRQICIGNPDDNSSHFAKICQSEPGWRRFKISAFDSPNFTNEWVPDEVAESLVRKSWVADKLERWGESNPLYRAKVLAEFADSADGLIPLSWVRQANARWEEWFENWDGYGAGDYEACKTALWRGGTHEPPGARLIALDVATVGEDRSAFTTKQGPIVLGIEAFQGKETPALIGLMADRLRAPAARGIIDAVGEGSGLYQVMQHDYPVTAFKSSYGTKMRDSSGTIRFDHWREAALWHLRELLDPLFNPTLALPPDDELTAELTAPKYEPRAGGKVWIESSAEIGRRIGRSPDLLSSVSMACFYDQIGTPDTPSGEQRKRQPRRAISYASSPSW